MPRGLANGSVALMVLVGAACSEPVEPVDCTTPGTACPWAGTGERGFNVENPIAHRLDSKLYNPTDLTFGPDGRAYLADWNNQRIRRVEADDSLRVVIGTDYSGDGAPNNEDLLPLCNPFGALGTTVALNHPTDVEFGPDGKLYVAVWHNYKLRVFDPATDLVTTVAGDREGFAGDGGPACKALFDQPKAVAIAPDGTLYTIDQRNVRIRAIAPDKTVTTIAGSGTVGDLGDGGLAVDAQLGFDDNVSPQPSGGIVLRGRLLYIADSLNHRIRRIDLDTGIIDCIAGQGEPGYAGDGGPALQARFNNPVDLELGPDGRLYVADSDNHVVRAIDLASGLIETVVGTGERCDLARELCDARPAREMRLNRPHGIAFDAAGDLYVADTYNHRILKVLR